MILARKFSLAEDDDYEHLAAAGGRLRALLEAFTEDRLPSEYGPEQLVGYARSLLAVQRPDGSFASCTEPEKLDPDVRTDVHRFVTWAGLAFLCRLQDFHAGGLNERLKEGISAALRCPVTADLSFPESGMAEPVQQVEAVLILSSGRIPARLKADPSLAPALKAVLDHLTSDFRRRLESGDTLLPGGIDYETLFRQALAALES